MIRLPSTDRFVRAARTRRAPSARLWIAAALAGWLGCASDPPAPPPALEVLRTTNEDGSVRYTIRRNRSAEEATTPPDSGQPAPAPGGDGNSGSGGEADAGPSDQIRNQLENDREFLRQMISRNAPAGFERSQDPQLREIAERLPRLQAELETLENEPEP